MTANWHETLPVLDDFSQIIDPSQYVPLPGDWCIGLADVVTSTAAIKAGHYKAVNLAGAGTIVPFVVAGHDECRNAIALGQDLRDADVLRFRPVLDLACHDVAAMNHERAGRQLVVDLHEALQRGLRGLSNH